jgi:hypothetical protein
VPEGQQVLGQGAGAGDRVAPHPVDLARGDATVHNDDRDAVRLEEPERRARAPGGDQQHAVDLALDEDAEVVGLLPSGLVGVTEDDRETTPRSHLLHAVGDGGEEGVRDVRDDEGKGLGAFRAQLAGQCIGHVAELRDGHLDPVARGLLDVSRLADDPGHGHRRYTGQLGDVADGGHAGTGS